MDIVDYTPDGEPIYSAMPELPEDFDEPVLPIWDVLDWQDIYPR